MPYEIKKSKAGGVSGFRVYNTETGEYYSKKALPLDTSKLQRTAIILSEMGKTQKPKMKNMKNGGVVPKSKYPAVEGRPKDFGDTVPAILESGEVVIPVELADKVKKFLRSQKIKLPGM